MIKRIIRWFFKLVRGNSEYTEILAEPITTTDATATAWTAIEILPDTSIAGSATVRYVFSATQSDGANLYSITSECSWSWPAGGPIVRRAGAAGTGTSNANSFAAPRPTHTFDAANVRPTITGKAATTIMWKCHYRVLT
jgi:hypothetical protein